MKKELFLFEDKISDINSSFIKAGWITVYERNYKKEENQILIYPCLVNKKLISKYREDRDWMIHPGSEGEPSIYSTYVNNKEKQFYESRSKEGIEAFIFSKSFHFNNSSESYIDVSEEFVNYFKLYEKITSKQERKYYFIDDSGDLDEVIDVSNSFIKVKLKYVKEYISVRNMYFAVCFDFMRFGSIEENQTPPQDKDLKGKNFIYNHFIRPIEYHSGLQMQSWIHGKCIIDFDKTLSNSYHFNKDNKNESYITGYDDNGNEILTSCEKTDDNYFVLTYFKKEVLNKYYNDPEKYNVSNFNIQSPFFSIKIDNNIPSYIPVFLIELRMLPHKEQLHWKHYNIPPQAGISHSYYRTMIEGSWAEHPETPDSYFKYKYYDFNHKWNKKFGWNFYKPLTKESSHYLDSLHIPTTNSIKSFCEQMLGLVILTIDSLNEGEISKGLILENSEKGIAKLDLFLKSKSIDRPEMIEFLRHLQNLRSGLIAHRFSTSNRSISKSLKYFGLQDENRIDVATEVFIKSIFTLNTLEKAFLLNDVIE